MLTAALRMLKSLEKDPALFTSTAFSTMVDPSGAAWMLTKLIIARIAKIDNIFFSYLVQKLVLIFSIKKF